MRQDGGEWVLVGIGRKSSSDNRDIRIGESTAWFCQVDCPDAGADAEGDGFFVFDYYLGFQWMLN